jgi:predicted peroxiredoxin
MKDLSKLINRMIDKAIIGCDKYVHNHSTWLIFTDEKKWIIELTKDGTLWYNYNFFKNLFKVISLDVVENQNYITKWVEDTIINGVKNTSHSHGSNNLVVEDTIINGVNYTLNSLCYKLIPVEDTIINGVKNTSRGKPQCSSLVEDTIINGVKETNSGRDVVDKFIIDTLENGVKETLHYDHHCLREVVGTIQNGVKHTRRNGDSMNTDAEDAIINGVKETKYPLGNSILQVEDAIENGVKQTSSHGFEQQNIVEDTIQNGVKETKKGGFNQHYQMFRTIEGGVKTKPALESHEGFMMGTPYVDKFFTKEDVENTIQNGVKEVKTDDSYRNYFRQSNKSEQVIEDGVKLTEETVTGSDKTLIAESVIKNGIKETKTPGEDGNIIGALDFMSDNNTVNIPQLIEDIITNGVKRTEGGVLFDETKVDRIISEGVKETKGGGYLGSIEMKGKIIHQLESPKQNNEVDDVIEHGVKLTNSSLQIDGSCVVEDVIQNGIKETHDDVYHHKGRVDGVIRNGVKEIKPAYRKIYNPINFEPVMIEDKRIPDITDVICDGIKEVQPLPAQDGNRDWGKYYHGKEDRTKPHTKYVDEVIDNGIKETKLIDYSDNTEFIVNGVISRGTIIE